MFLRQVNHLFHNNDSVSALYLSPLRFAKHFNAAAAETNRLGRFVGGKPKSSGIIADRARDGRPGRWPCHCKFPPPALPLARELSEPRRVMRD